MAHERAVSAAHIDDGLARRRDDAVRGPATRGSSAAVPLCLHARRSRAGLGMPIHFNQSFASLGYLAWPNTDMVSARMPVSLDA